MRRKIRLAIMVVALWPCTVFAQPAKDMDLCRGDDSADRIPACARIIDNNKSTNKDRATAFYLRGMYLRERQPERAIEDFTHAIQIDPKNWLNYLQRGRIYLSAKKLDLALSDAKEQFDLGPDDFYKFGFRGDVYFAMGNTDLATIDFLAAAKMASGKDSMKLAISDLLTVNRVAETADVLNRIDDPDTILEYRVFRDEGEKLWSNPKTDAALSMPAVRGRAIATAQTAVQRNPRNLRLKYYLMEAFRYAGNFPEAERLGYETLGTLAAHEPDAELEAWIRGELADDLVEDGKQDQARTVFKSLPSIKAEGVFAQFINYAGQLLDAENYRDALTYLLQAKAATDHFDVMFAQIEGCAKYKLGNRAEAAAIVNDMLNHSEIAKYSNYSEAAIEALFCLGRDSEAATLLIKQLQAHPGSLIRQQKCESDPALPLDRENRRKFQQLYDRPDVRAVIEPLGRTSQDCQQTDAK